jgi:phi13 family phage major tail protein
MAEVGLRYLVFAPFASHAEGSMITYGQGIVVGMLTTADVAITRNSVKLPADDVIAEEDNSINSANITAGIDDLPLAREAVMLGQAVTGEDANKLYEDTDDAAPLGGLGYVRVRRKTDQETGIITKTYIGTWWYKGRTRIETESSKTKGETVEFGTPVIIFGAQGASVDSSGKMKFRARKEFATYELAKAFINDYANITNTTTTE